MHAVLLKAGIGLAAVAGTAWFGLSAYHQPRERAAYQHLVTDLLDRALAGDSAGLAKRAGAVQPVEWALALAREDSFALRAWASHGGAVFLTSRGDTTWIALPRHPDTPSCDTYGSLVATAIAPPGRDKPRIVRLTATCLEAAENSPTP